MIKASMSFSCCFYVVFAGIRWIMRLCSDCDELYIWFFFYILFLSNSCMFSVAFYYFGQVVDSNSKRERLCLIVGSCPPMSSLSDRNMRLGDVLLPPGRKQRLSLFGNGRCHGDSKERGKDPRRVSMVPEMGLGTS